MQKNLVNSKKCITFVSLNQLNIKVMKVINEKKFAYFKYESVLSSKYRLGDIVIKESEQVPEIGVILQIHDEYEYRTDMFGNCSCDEIRLANIEEIKKYRPELIPEILKE